MPGQRTEISHRGAHAPPLAEQELVGHLPPALETGISSNFESTYKIDTRLYGTNIHAAKLYSTTCSVSLCLFFPQPVGGGPWLTTQQPSCGSTILWPAKSRSDALSVPAFCDHSAPKGWSQRTQCISPFHLIVLFGGDTKSATRCPPSPCALPLMYTCDLIACARLISVLPTHLSPSARAALMSPSAPIIWPFLQQSTP